MIKKSDLFKEIKQRVNIRLSQSDIYQFMAFLLNDKYDQIPITLNDEIFNFDYNKFEKYLTLLNEKMPLAYLIGKTYFCGNEFIVNSDVLIPRNDTELLIDEIKSSYDSNESLIIGDICTGSGAIGISLAKIFPKSKIYISDISEPALKVAEKNINHNYVENVEIKLGDFVEPFIKEKIKLDVLVSNPPYIQINDCDVDESVYKYEPHLALFAEDGGLEFYKRILNSIDTIMNFEKDWMIILEYGWKQKEEIESIFSKSNYLQEHKKDHFGNWRYVILKKEK
ncbi:peptide chain release factor N(5)-glutamine methyltransferase [Mesoplasma photuris]|uniref:peptide chain release factor N(5)-glutamine methyltransferase n=1 Tax=Mesoplasma photuris TaxID=217731 RepID=UPI00068DC7D8|nr:peptide chain release factor N(5)-glutamine methyltransferase [Mesoplasma photuris]